MNNRINDIPEDIHSKILALANQYHLKNEGFSFHYNNPSFLKQLKEIVKDFSPIYDLLNEGSYVTTRRVSSTDNKLCYKAHFDQYESTLLVLLKSPKSDQNGDFIFWENARKMPRNVWTHVIGKAIFQNIIALWMIKKLYNINGFFNKFVRIKVRPGQCFHFNGFVDLHFNLPVGTDERFSLLIHNKEKFSESAIVKLIGSYSQYSVKNSSVTQ